MGREAGVLYFSKWGEIGRRDISASRPQVLGLGFEGVDARALQGEHSSRLWHPTRNGTAERAPWSSASTPVQVSRITE